MDDNLLFCCVELLLVSRLSLISLLLLLWTCAIARFLKNLPKMSRFRLVGSILILRSRLLLLLRHTILVREYYMWMLSLNLFGLCARFLWILKAWWNEFLIEKRNLKDRQVACTNSAYCWSWSCNIWVLFCNLYRFVGR